MSQTVGACPDPWAPEAARTVVPGACPGPREPASLVDVFDDWESKRGGRGQNRRLGVRIRPPDGRFERLGDKNGRFERLGDRKRRPIVQNVHEAPLKAPNRAKRPRLEARAIAGCEVRTAPGQNGPVWQKSEKCLVLPECNQWSKTTIVWLGLQQVHRSRHKDLRLALAA